MKNNLTKKDCNRYFSEGIQRAKKKKKKESLKKHSTYN